jgi:hypothetical protein
MYLTPRAASSIASALPSWRVLLLFGGFLTLSESIALATTFFVGAFVSFVASLLIATAGYRRSGPGAADAPESGAVRLGEEPHASAPPLRAERSSARDALVWARE